MKAAEIRKIVEDKVIGKWVAEHDVFGHHYRNVESGILEDSVTTKNIIEKPHLGPWAAGLAIDFLEKGDNFSLLQTERRDEILQAAKLQCRDVLEDAGSIGSIAHDAIEEYIKEWAKTGKPPKDIRDFLEDKDDYRAWASARAAENAFKKYSVTPIMAEFIVGKEGWGAGTLDLLVLNEDGQLEMWDWKTSNGIDDFYACQISAYTKMFEYMTDLKISKARIFKLDKESDRYKTYEVVDIDESFEIFLACSKISDWKNRTDEKLVQVKNKLKI